MSARTLILSDDRTGPAEWTGSEAQLLAANAEADNVADLREVLCDLREGAADEVSFGFVWLRYAQPTSGNRPG